MLVKGAQDSGARASALRCEHDRAVSRVAVRTRLVLVNADVALGIAIAPSLGSLTVCGCSSIETWCSVESGQAAYHYLPRPTQSSRLVADTNVLMHISGAPTCLVVNDVLSVKPGDD